MPGLDHMVHQSSKSLWIYRNAAFINDDDEEGGATKVCSNYGITHTSQRSFSVDKKSEDSETLSQPASIPQPTRIEFLASIGGADSLVR